VATSPANTGSLQVIGLTLNVVGGYFETENFFNQLEGMSRALKVTGFSMAPGTNPMKASAAGGTTSAATGATDGRTLATAVTASVFMSPTTAVAASPVK
jgi:hypothetical protein